MLRTSFLSLVLAVAALPAIGQEDPWYGLEAQRLLAAVATSPSQSTDPTHPGSNVYAYTSFTTQDIVLPDNKKTMRVWTPTGAVGQLPLVVWGAGKTLSNPTNYQAMFEHLVKKGMVVANIQFEGSFFDTDFVKFGRWFNNGVKLILSKVPTADPNQVYYAGHSLGAQVTIIAAGLATGGDTANAFVDPKGVISNSFDNSRGPFNKGDLAHPACGYAEKVGPNVQVLIFEFEDDTIAGPAKTYAQALYNKLPSLRKQWVLVKGKNLGSTYALVADHNTPMTAGSAPAGGAPKLNALDWHMVWKGVAGLPLVVSGVSPDADPWVFGNGLVDGGTAPNGTVLYHVLKARSF